MNKPVVIEKTRRELELNYLPKNHEATAKHLPDVYYKNKKGGIESINRRDIKTLFRQSF